MLRAFEPAASYLTHGNSREGIQHMTTNRTVKKLQKTAMILMLGMLVTGSASHKAVDSTSSRTISVKVDGMSCPFCAYGLEKRLKKIKGTKKVIIYIDKGQAILRLKDNAPLDTRAVMKAVKKGGFTPRKITITAVGKVNKENGRWVFHPKGTDDIFLLAENSDRIVFSGHPSRTLISSTIANGFVKYTSAPTASISFMSRISEAHIHAG